MQQAHGLRFSLMSPSQNGRRNGKTRRGRPTKYDSAYCGQLVKFFSEDPYKEVEVTHTNTKGESWSRFELRPNDPPFFSAFARKINVDTDTLYEWVKQHPDFSVAMARARGLREEFIATCGFLGISNPQITALMLKTHHHYSDREAPPPMTEKPLMIVVKVNPTNGESSVVPAYRDTNRIPA